MINRTINYGYDSRDDFNGPFGIIAMIDSAVNHDFTNSPIVIMH